MCGGNFSFFRWKFFTQKMLLIKTEILFIRLIVFDTMRNCAQSFVTSSQSRKDIQKYFILFWFKFLNCALRLMFVIKLDNKHTTRVLKKINKKVQYDFWWQLTSFNRKKQTILRCNLHGEIGMQLPKLVQRKWSQISVDNKFWETTFSSAAKKIRSLKILLTVKSNLKTKIQTKMYFLYVWVVTPLLQNKIIALLFF